MSRAKTLNGTARPGPKSAKSTAPRAQKSAKKAPKKRRNPPARSIKDPVAASDATTRKGYGHGDQNNMQAASLRRTHMLKKLMEPKTEAMVGVLEEIALNKCVSAVHKDENGQPLPIDVHPSIRLEAASRYLDRCHGKPKEHLVIDEPDAVEDQDEVTRLLNNILKSVGAPLLDGPASEEFRAPSQEGDHGG